MKKYFLLILVLLALSDFQMLKSQTPLSEAIDFEVTDLEGNNIHLFEILDQGKYVLIDFYFTTCVPCQTAVPKISEAFEYFGCGEYDVFFMAMDFGDTHEECLAFDEEFAVAYPSVSGVEGGGTAVCEDYQIPLYPCIVLIAPDRSIVEQNIWPIPSAETVISALEAYGINQNECALEADFIAYNNDICDYDYILFNDRSLGNISSWEWTFEGGLPPNSNDQNPTILFPSSGQFDVSLTITNENGESTITKQDIARVHNCTGTLDLEHKNNLISPNPSKGGFLLSLPKEEAFHIEVYDTKGALVFQSLVNNTKNKLDLKHLNKGIYYVIAYNRYHNFKEKIIIQ